MCTNKESEGVLCTNGMGSCALMQHRQPQSTHWDLSSSEASEVDGIVYSANNNLFTLQTSDNLHCKQVISACANNANHLVCLSPCQPARKSLCFELFNFKCTWPPRILHKCIYLVNSTNWAYLWRRECWHKDRAHKAESWRDSLYITSQVVKISKMMKHKHTGWNLSPPVYDTTDQILFFYNFHQTEAKERALWV